MGEAKRRRLQAGLDRMHAEGQGVFAATIVPAEHALALMLRPFHGDSGATRTMRMVADYVANLGKQGGALCMTCDGAITFPAGPSIFVHAGRDDPRMAVGSGICQACRDRAGDIATLKPRIVEALQQLNPGLREVVVHDAEGHA